MPLDEYRAKRDFGSTPEPSGGEIGARDGADGGLHYVIQKHDASRLHYDFRLELDGVLLSWAVPKGPSIDPTVKRLAARVEDHPLEYGGFEGIIPEGEYGGGTVNLWDRGTWVPEGDPHKGLAKGDFKFTLYGEKLGGSWVLVRMKPRGNEKGENWLLIKHRDEFAVEGDDDALLRERPESVLSGRDLDEIAADPASQVHGGEPPTASDVPGATSARLPRDPFAPQLATLVREAPGSGKWLHEIKFDGYRIVTEVRDGTVTMYTRNGKDWTDRFAPIAEALSHLPVKSAILDGEVVVQNADGISDFGALQADLADGRTDRMHYQLFDLVHLDGYDLAGAALTDRKAALEALVKLAPGGQVSFVEDVRGDGPEFFSQACAHGLEGIISKRVDSRYRPGSRGRDWVKVKCTNRQEFAIVGYTPPSGSRVGFGSLLLAEPGPDGALTFAGKVGTGFSDLFLEEFGARLRRIERKRPTVDAGAEGADKDAVWVKPEFVAEVEFSERTKDGRLRHAVYRGLRDDKAPEDIVADRPIESAASIPTITLTNADRVFYKDVGTTKQDLADYYVRIAPHLLPYSLNRPVSMVRCPQGVAARPPQAPHPGVKSCFFHKHPSRGFPDAFDILDIEESKGAAEYLAITGVDSLVGLVQMGVLEIHTWGATAPDIEHPDTIVFDLDPDEGIGWDQLADAARLVRDVLDGLGLTSFVKTTGGKGVHVTVPIVPDRSWDEVRGFAKAVAVAIADHDPDHYVATMSKAKRVGRVFIDYLRNGRSATFIAPYSTRARQRPTIATPITWEELDGDIRPDTFDLGNIDARMASLKQDPWEGYFDLDQRLTDAMMIEMGV